MSYYDPVLRAARHGVPLTFRGHHSYKCWDERCLHYIFGYPLRDERDQHAKEHVSLHKRDSGLSISSMPPLPFPDPPTRNHSVDYSKQTSPLYLPRPNSNFQLAPLSTGGHPKDHRDSLRSYSFSSDYPGGPRGSIDSEVDPLLPPLKRSRVGQSRLESIEELRLNRDVGLCLRCRVLKKGVGILSWSFFGSSLADAYSATPMTHAHCVRTVPIPRTRTFGSLSGAIEALW